jgi:excisionase family DNA binding protein
MPQPIPEQVLTLQELAVYIRIAESSIYKLVREGRIPAQKLGKQWRFHRPTIDLWLAGNTTALDSKPKKKSKGKAT